MPCFQPRRPDFSKARATICCSHGTTPSTRGFISVHLRNRGVRHPDKGTEMYVNELGAAEVARHLGVATSLVEALAALAKGVGCSGMWEVCDPDNVGALATYRRAGAHDEAPAVVCSWQF
jgi:ribosomal protein S18 acetylase RimI-like enzyme